MAALWQILMNQSTFEKSEGVSVELATEKGSGLAIEGSGVKAKSGLTSTPFTVWSPPGA